MKYLISFLNGFELEFQGTLEDAEEYANKNLSFTKLAVCIYIHNDTHKIASILPWYDGHPDEDYRPLKQYADAGYYSEWVRFS